MAVRGRRRAAAQVDLKVSIVSTIGLAGVTAVRVHGQRGEQGFKILPGKREGTVAKATGHGAGR